jgi:transglutaminase-like putative cysteine protease
MLRQFSRMIACCLLLSCLAADALAQSRPLNAKILRDDVPARLIELTAHLKVSNKTATPIRKYVFRVTAPADDVEAQRATLLESDVPVAVVKTHKTDANRYLEFHFPVGPNAVAAHDVKFLVLAIPVDYTQVKKLPRPKNVQAASLERYVESSPYIEVDSPEVRAAAAKVFDPAQTVGAKAFAAYRYPSQVLKFRLQTEKLGAQKALQTKVGDCTDHACVFAALCRTQGIPARRLAVFNLGSNEEIDVPQPNHDIAEVYLESHGWIPVDANLGRGRKDRPVGFAKLSNTFILMSREGAWVWSTWLPPNGYAKSDPKPKVEYGISWDAKVLKDGPAQELYGEFTKLERGRLKSQ